MSATLAEVVWYNEDSASPLTVSKPAGFATGDVLVAVIHQHGPTGHVTDLTAPTGWTQVTGDLAGTNSQGRVFYRVFTGSEPSTWDFPYYTNADTCLALFRITGADTTPTISLTTANSTSVGASFDSPTITPAAVDDLLICTIGDIADGNTFSATVPAGMTVTSPASTQIGGGFMALAAATQQLASASATGAKTWTSVSPAGHDGGTFSVVVKSAAGAAAPANIAPISTTGPGRMAPSGVFGATMFTDRSAFTVWTIDATLTATATITAAAAVTRPVDASLTGTATVTSTAAVTRPVDATLTAAAAITVTAAVTRPVTAALTGTAAVTTTGLLAAAGVSTLSGTATTASTAAVDRPVTATLSGTATATTASTVDRPVDATLTGTAAITAAAAVTVTVDAALIATASWVVLAGGIAATASLTATATVTAAATVGGTAVPATSTASVVPAATSSSAVTARRTSTSTAAASRTSTPTVTGG